MIVKLQIVTNHLKERYRILLESILIQIYFLNQITGKHLGIVERGLTQKERSWNLL